MLVVLDYTDKDGKRVANPMPLELCINRWPWLEGYRKELDAGLAIFAEEGVFVEEGVWRHRNEAP